MAADHCEESRRTKVYQYKDSSWCSPLTYEPSFLINEGPLAEFPIMTGTSNPVVWVQANHLPLSFGVLSLRGESLQNEGAN